MRWEVVRGAGAEANERRGEVRQTMGVSLTGGMASGSWTRSRRQPTGTEPQAGVWPMISSHGGETEVKGKTERKWESATEDVDGAAARNAVWTRTSFTQALGAPSQCRSTAKIQSRHPFGSIREPSEVNHVENGNGKGCCRLSQWPEAAAFLEATAMLLTPSAFHRCGARECLGQCRCQHPVPALA